MGKSFIVKHTVPVWVEVDGATGEVTKVVIEVEELSEPLGVVTEEKFAQGWMDEDVIAWDRSSPFRREHYEKRCLDGQTWPGWQFGW